MRKLGLVGGVGPEATLMYYQGITYGVKRRVGRDFFPRLSVESLSCFDVIPMSAAGKKAELAEYFLSALESLAAGGAEFGALACCTGHLVFEELERRSPIPLVSIVEVTAEAAKRAGAKRVGLLGTQATMEEDFFKKPFIERGIEVAVPNGPERRWVADKILSELENGLVKPETVEGFMKLAKTLAERDGIEALVLGCTELPMVFSRFEPPVAALDAAAIHIEALADAILA